MCRITGFGFHRVAELELDAVAPLVDQYGHQLRHSSFRPRIAVSFRESGAAFERRERSVSERQWD